MRRYQSQYIWLSNIHLWPLVLSKKNNNMVLYRYASAEYSYLISVDEYKSNISKPPDREYGSLHRYFILSLTRTFTVIHRSIVSESWTSLLWHSFNNLIPPTHSGGRMGPLLYLSATCRDIRLSSCSSAMSILINDSGAKRSDKTQVVFFMFYFLNHPINMMKLNKFKSTYSISIATHMLAQMWTKWN